MREAIAGAMLALLLAFGGALPAAAEEEASLEQCQALANRIHRYTALRRLGGTARQMEGWREQLRRAETAFREKDCRAYRRELE